MLDIFGILEVYLSTLGRFCFLGLKLYIKNCLSLLWIKIVSISKKVFHEYYHMIMPSCIMFTEQKIYTMQLNHFVLQYWRSSNEEPSLRPMLGVEYPLAFEKNVYWKMPSWHKLFENLHHYSYRTLCAIWRWPIEAV